MKTKYANLGSVSSATMRAEDLIPCFVGVLDDIRENIAAPGPTTEPSAETEERKQTVSRLDDILGAIEQRMRAEDYYESESADYDLEDLFTALEEFAPPYCYFGTNEGDGADYGFWIAWDSLEDDCRYGDVLKIPSGDEWPEDLEGAEYVLEVNDHGNAMLYATDHTEVWSCV